VTAAPPPPVYSTVQRQGDGGMVWAVGCARARARPETWEASRRGNIHAQMHTLIYLAHSGDSARFLAAVPSAA